jgi:4-oxalocrotonate tautomerase
MPFVRIDLVAGKPAEYRAAIGEVVYDAMLATINVPKDDRFQIVTEHPSGDFVIDPTYAGIQRTQDCIVIQVTLNEGRTTDQKRAFYHAIAHGLHDRLGVQLGDVFINLVEVKKENWSFGNGEAQYA